MFFILGIVSIVVGIVIGSIVYPKYKDTTEGTWWVLFVLAGVVVILYAFLYR